MATNWDKSRAAARALRSELTETDGGDISAEGLLNAALERASLRCRLRPPRDPLLSGAHAVLDMELQTVWVRSDAPASDRRVFIAHELAHFHLHENGKLCHCAEADFTEPETMRSVGYGPRQRRETEANVFAREFLLPAAEAKRLFAAGDDARALAARTGLPINVVFAQLTEALTKEFSREDSAQSAAESSLENAAVVSLDPSQEAAAKAAAGPLLVGAGPGTGKTRTLTARILYLTNTLEVPAENILALTFSRKAAEEMRERIAAIDPEIARRALIATFHAYGLDLLRRQGKALGLPANPILLEAADAISLLERRAAELDLSALSYLHDPAYPLPDMLNAIRKAKEDGIEPDEYAARAAASGNERLIETGRVYAVYAALLNDKGAMDYSDLVRLPLRLLEAHEEIRAAEQAQWRHILVDEYQDINRSGARLIQLIAGDGKGLWAVGDVRQAIYRFRGASPANVKGFLDDFPTGRRTDLKVNYRSQPGLVRLFGIASGEGPDNWQAAREDTGATVALAVADDDRAQADGIAARMRAFVDASYSFGDMAVLCRTRRQGRDLRAALLVRGIPVAAGAEESGGLLGVRDVRDMVAALARSAEPNSPARQRFAELPEGLPYRSDSLDFFQELLWGRPAWGRRVTDAAAVGRLLALARAFRERATAVLEDQDEPRRAFLSHLRRMARIGASFGDPEGENEEANAVRVLTAHSAKGLEYPIVFVANLSMNKFPSRPGPALIPPLPGGDDEDGGIEEERRLFFVALTRAKDHLILSRAMKYGQRAEMPSPLLAPLHRVADIEDVSWTTEECAQSQGARRKAQGAGSDTENRESSLLPSASFPSSDGDLRPATRDLIIEAGEVELYMRCPRRYYYERVLKAPAGERTPYAVFKNSVEKALALPDPVTGLEAAWLEHGMDDSHPHAPLYRRAAAEIVRRVSPLPLTLTPSEGREGGIGVDTSSGTPQAPGAPLPAASVFPLPDTFRGEGVRERGPGGGRRNPDAPTLAVELKGGTLSVQPDDVTPGDAGLEMTTFRRPPVGDEIWVPNDERRISLLWEAARQRDPDTKPNIRLRYLRDGKAYVAPDKSKIRQRHLQEYEQAIEGIRLNVFNPKPADAADCPACPYFFLCPDE